MYASVTQRPNLYRRLLFHDVPVPISSTLLFHIVPLYETAVPYSYMPLLHRASFSIGNCYVILLLYASVTPHSRLYRKLFFLYASVTSRSHLYRKLQCHIAPIHLCYITLPSLYETAVPYCSCIPLLHHTPLSIDCCYILFLYPSRRYYCFILFLYASVT